MQMVIITDYSPSCLTQMTCGFWQSPVSLSMKTQCWQNSIFCARQPSQTPRLLRVPALVRRISLPFFVLFSIIFARIGFGERQSLSISLGIFFLLSRHQRAKSSIFSMSFWNRVHGLRWFNCCFEMPASLAIANRLSLVRKFAPLFDNLP